MVSTIIIIIIIIIHIIIICVVPEHSSMARPPYNLCHISARTLRLTSLAGSSLGRCPLYSTTVAPLQQRTYLTQYGKGEKSFYLIPSSFGSSSQSEVNTGVQGFIQIPYVWRGNSPRWGDILGMWGCTLSGSRGRAPGQGVWGKAPPEDESFLLHK